MRPLRLGELQLTISEFCATPFGSYRCGQDGDYALWLQFVLKAPNYREQGQGPGSVSEWRGRKWRVSMYSTEREVVGTAFCALLQALEHEARESFTYLGHAVFGPHIPLVPLIEASKSEQDSRA